MQKLVQVSECHVFHHDGERLERHTDQLDDAFGHGEFAVEKRERERKRKRECQKEIKTKRLRKEKEKQTS